MSLGHAAERAEAHQVWADGLRIKEVAASRAVAARQPSGTPYFDMLRKALQQLQTGWKWLECKRTAQLSSRRLHLSETISLGEKRTVSIVQVDGAQYLIGCSTGSVQLLAVLDKQENAAQLPVSERAS